MLFTLQLFYLTLSNGQLFNQQLKLKKMFTLSLMPNFKGTVKEFIICCSILMLIDSTYLIPMFNALNK